VKEGSGRCHVFLVSGVLLEDLWFGVAFRVAYVSVYMLVKIHRELKIERYESIYMIVY